MEEFVKGDHPDFEKLVVGRVLVMTILRSPPDLMKKIAGALLGVAWQTKVERKKRGTRWACTRGSITGYDWVEDC